MLNIWTKMHLVSVLPLLVYSPSLPWRELKTLLRKFNHVENYNFFLCQLKSSF